jgi:hypothetical protein
MKEVVKYSDYYEQESKAYTEGIDYDDKKDIFQNYFNLWNKIKGVSMINFFMSNNSDYADVVSK